jgi:hypothetical protein
VGGGGGGGGGRKVDRQATRALSCARCGGAAKQAASKGGKQPSGGALAAPAGGISGFVPFMPTNPAVAAVAAARRLASSGCGSRRRRFIRPSNRRGGVNRRDIRGGAKAARITRLRMLSSSTI